MQEKSNKGHVFAYSGSSIVSSKPGEYILKIHGNGMTNIMMQVETENDLMLWNARFNTRIDTSTDASYYRNELQGETCLNPLENKQDGDSEIKRISTNIKRLTRQSRLDSGITTHRLLDNEEDGDEDYQNGERRGSDMTATTVNSCYNQPAVLLTDYGTDEINHARQIQQQRQNPETAYSASMMLGSITDQEHRHTSHDPRVSFYSSFVGYLSNTGLSNALGTPDSESTVVVTPPLSDTAEENTNHSNYSNIHNFNHNSAGSSII
ncbi:hypothetical protein HPULCUR_007093 [Helicostylum pulchrum]|uniref:Uncharacterized protein n=1 Tax=Helicostylum pulchrum TaxID=562976 RepID=A0ABP9Y3S5_9FUNG